MKLSARDKQRLQWGVLGVLGAVAVLYACIQLVIIPLWQAKMKGMNRLAKYNELINLAKGNLGGLAGIQTEVDKLQTEASLATNRFVIRPVLGSMLVTVQNQIEPMAKSYGLQINSCSERGRLEMPVNKKDAVQTIERYLAEIAATGPYAAVRDFVMALEKTNSYICVTDVEIVAQPGDVLNHKVRIGMEWPVFGPAKAPAPAQVRTGKTAASLTEDEL